ncbi:hypothetical protein AGMMS49949_05930 [Alphaproteobacteria bacterium]|nr:hypothetical protein AGMMS49949_05930 [Alphaproteobacteria bacterium]
MSLAEINARSDLRDVGGIKYQPELSEAIHKSSYFPSHIQ